VKLSACMIVKNEEAMLEHCLRSLEGVDEIIICDTGSTDKTIEIAKRYTSQVFSDFVWCDDFAAARNHAIGKATGDWILTIDADEAVAPGSLALIREAIQTADKAIECRVKSVDSSQVFYNIRVYKNTPEIKWVKPIHNHLNVAATDRCEAMIVFGYSPAHTQDPDRAFRILKKYVEEHPEAGRERYYLAREYWYRKQYNQAVTELDSYFPKASYIPERADAYLMKARCLWALRRGEEARTACMYAILNNANFKEAVSFMAELSWTDNADAWRRFAQQCTNEGVLFARTVAT